jgi:hypothetical protein
MVVGALLLSVPALAVAGQDRGGGVAFVCKKKQIFGKKTVVYLADSYNIVHSPVYERLKSLKFSDSEKVLQEAIQIVREKNAQVGDALATAMGQIQESLEGSLPLLGNDRIEQMPENCTKEQLGIQDFETGVVHVNHRLRSKLNPVDQLLFRLHEGYLRVLWLADRDPSIQAVRDQVFTWTKDPQFVEFLQASREMPAERGACLIPVFNSPRMCAHMDRKTCASLCNRDPFTNADSCAVYVGGPC